VRVFLRFGSPRLLVGAIAITLAARLAIGEWSWLDLAVAGSLVALQPFHEWLIHVGLLHARPLRLGPLVVDLPSARIHRAHHRDPTVLRTVLLPVSGIPIILALIAGALWLLTWPLVLVGGHHLPLFLSTALCGAVLVAVYEWSHFLIHSPYRPRSRYYKAIWRSHRLHHFKNEHYWFGVSSDAADRVLGTNPDHREVPRSKTARDLAASDRGGRTT
jgi:sterol desaturase/sphingolipid hydroxylase (fatty acid hydroxylase superfamily)